MLIILQFPIVDSRKFVDCDTQKLPKPFWPTPIPNEEFIRSTGVIRSRPCGGLTGWLSEAYVCEANKALRFQNLASFRKNSGGSIRFKVAFRRFYFDGLAVGKFEVGIAAWGFNFRKRRMFRAPDELSDTDTRNFFLHVLNLPVMIPNYLEGYVTCNLWQAGEHLANLYLTSSTSKQALAEQQKYFENSWVKACEPIILTTYDRNDERLQIPFPNKSVSFVTEGFYESFLSHAEIPHEGRIFRMWLTDNNPLLRDYTFVRQLRIFILRLHAERTCLRQILRDISIGKLIVPQKSDKLRLLQEYLNQATKRIKRLSKHSNTRLETDIEELAREAEECISPGECDALFNALRVVHIEKNIFQKVKDFVRQPILIRSK